MIHGTYIYICSQACQNLSSRSSETFPPPKKNLPRAESLQGGGRGKGGGGIGIAYSVHVLYLHKLSYFILFGLSDEKEKKGWVNLLACIYDEREKTPRMDGAFFFFFSPRIFV